MSGELLVGDGPPRSRRRRVAGRGPNRQARTFVRRKVGKLARPRAKPLEIVPWQEPRSLESIATLAEYVGSPEHKTQTNPLTDEPPRPRAESDGSRCEEYPAEEWPGFTESLRAAIRGGCVAGTDAGEWPRYVWGFHRDRLFQARHRTDPPGNRYKGWWIEPEERPKDVDGRLASLEKERART